VPTADPSGTPQRQQDKDSVQGGIKAKTKIKDLEPDSMMRYFLVECFRSEYQHHTNNESYAPHSIEIKKWQPGSGKIKHLFYQKLASDLRKFH
jgi:hypothetical protein